ncbi:transposase [Nonomuraea thailandensis]|uniref:Transposase n=1 Tax=Nonomuraea thailandensis TaxID=1188745 RepID=A0A9X2G6I9_9ACTN|nr:transposase [Nonomuraea thailandensis]
MRQNGGHYLRIFRLFKTVFCFFSRWARAGVFNRIRDELRRAIRLRAGRCPNPVAGIIDSQSVRAAASVTGRSRSYDAGKKVGGRKRHLVVDTLGLLMTVMVTPAGQPDRDAARELLARLRCCTRRSPSSGATAPTPGRWWSPAFRIIRGS